MLFPPPNRLVGGLLATLLAGMPTVQAKDVPKSAAQEPDRPMERALANLELFGGRATPEYLDFKARVAEDQLQKWERLIPGTRAFRAQPAPTGIPAKAWTNIGPLRGQSQLYLMDANVADTGRPTVILPHPTDPNILYVGYAGGGLWRCTNADVTATGDWTWAPLTDALPAGSPAGNLSVGGAAFKPEDPNILYLALGDMEPGSADSTAEGRGFFISTDGGDNWVRGGTLGATTRVKTVLALSGNIVLVAGNAGLFRSTDGGASFAQVAIGAAPLSNTKGWDIVPMANGELVMSFQSTTTGGVVYSTDQGLTWTDAAISSELFTIGAGRIALAAQGNTMYGLFADKNGTFQKGVMKSTDGGHSWVWLGSTTLFNVSGDGAQAGYNHMIAVDPTDPNKVFAGTNLSLYRSLNGGADWERMTQWMGGDRQYNHADFHVHAWMKAPTGPKTLFLGTDGGLSVVRNPDINPIPTGTGGVLSDITFIDTRRNRNIATQLVYHVGSTTATTPPNSSQRVIVGLQDQGTRLRSEAGAADQSYNLVVGGDGFGCLIHPYDGNKMLGSIYYTRIYRSTDGGSSFVSSSTGITGAGYGNLAPFFTRLGQDMSDPTGNRVYTYTNTAPYVSNDFGASWTAMPTTGLTSVSAIRNISASPLAPNLVGVALNGGRVGLTSNGASWTTVAAASFPNNPSYMNCVAFDTADSRVMYASSVAFNATASHIWKSVNSGVTWTAIDVANGFPFGIPVHMVKVDPLDSTCVYAGTDLGLYRSTDGGATWARFGTGLPLVSVRDIYIAPDGTFMRIGTHGRGVWEMQGVTDAFAPVISSPPQNTSVYAGQNAVLTVIATGLPAPTFQWQISLDGSTWNNVASNGTSSTYTFPNAALSDTGTQFRVLVSNAVGTVTSAAATLTVLSPVIPSFTLQPTNQTQIAGLRVDFTGGATGLPAPTYQWQSSTDGTTWNNLAGSTTTRYRFYPATTDANKRFRLQANNSAGTTNSNVATLSLTPNLVQVLVNPDFEVTPFGNGWSWSHLASSMLDATNVHEGASAAVFGYWGAVTTDWAYQDVAIPANPTSANLSFWLKIWNGAGVPASVVNTMAVKVKDTSGADLATLGTFNNTTTGFASFAKAGPYDLRAFAGQTVRVYFTSSQTNAAYNTGFSLDDANLIVGTAPGFDINGDGAIDVYDLLELLKRYGSTVPADLAKSDFNGDGQINDADLTALLAAL